MRAVHCGGRFNGNSRGLFPIDVIRVGDLAEIPFGAEDPELLAWCEQTRRILVTHDPDTMPTHMADHLRAGHHSPGVFMIRPHTTLPQILAFLVDAAYASEPAEWQDRIQYIP